MIMLYFVVQIVKRAESWAKDLALDNMYYPKTTYIDGGVKYIHAYFFQC